jgi:hypothetical protein
MSGGMLTTEVGLVPPWSQSGDSCARNLSFLLERLGGSEGA